ncbi:hypothetical protein [Adhaeretor mobilis]|uniref:Uncharacterized protein n=1 Tax=Adhaeretor mobilis TaxID=1930276 RepID=A0A517MQB2_9BACT|nr:hypothetical protein [Adhaeretor mobilis]QDS97068.1 hypothetical protein HG15A2_03270 [Adhaeretor mobilis]
MGGICATPQSAFGALDLCELRSLRREGGCINRGVNGDKLSRIGGVHRPQEEDGPKRRQSDDATNSEGFSFVTKDNRPGALSVLLLSAKV